MPIHEIVCQACGFAGEVITLGAGESPLCPKCQSPDCLKLLSPTSSLSGQAGQNLPGASDTGCCGGRPGAAGCAGPGSCCGKV